MKPHQGWSYSYYRPVGQAADIYICRVAPGVSELSLSWLGGEREWTVYLRPKGSEGEWETQRVSTPTVRYTDLSNETDYEFFVTNGTLASAIGYARTGFVPGTVVNYLHPEDNKYVFSGRYLCTPSLLLHPTGYLLASMDVFMGKQPQNLTLIFRSDDGGESWYHYSELFPCFWGKLFLHRGDVYMLATSTEYGDLLIGRSSDGGKTFGEPTVLFRGSGSYLSRGWHKSAMPVIMYGGRLWTGIDYGAHCRGGHMSALLSAAEGADLLDADSWSLTEPLAYDPAWPGAVEGDIRGFLEGNAVVLPDGGVGELLRYSTDLGSPRYGRIPILRADPTDPEAALKFERLVDFPGNLYKFDILHDPISGCYVSLCSRIVDENVPRGRNVLSLVASTDLTDWRVVCDLLDYAHLDPALVGFQYVSICFDGEDLLYLSRTAFNGAANFHDNNYVTFHRLKDFRRLLNRSRG